METFYRSNWWKTLLILLVIANIASLSAFWWARSKSSELPGRAQTDPGQYLVNELSLNREQTARFEELRNEHHKKVEAIRENLRRLKDLYFSQLHNPAVTERQIRDSALSMAQAEAAIDVITFEHFRQVRAICDAAQKEKFDRIIEGLLRTMAQHPPGRPGPGGRPPMPGEGPPPGGEMGPPPGPPQ